jgi:hypothetical protein
VTITLADDGSFSYAAVNQDTHQPVTMTNKSLKVYTGDEVRWKASLPSAHKHRGSVRFTATTPFAKNEFKYSENNDDGGPITETAVSEHYYCVAIFDKHKQEIYTDDPKIIVGGRLEAVIVKAEHQLQAIKETMESIDASLKKALKDSSS